MYTTRTIYHTTIIEVAIFCWSHKIIVSITGNTIFLCSKICRAWRAMSNWFSVDKFTFFFTFTKWSALKTDYTYNSWSATRFHSVFQISKRFSNQSTYVWEFLPSSYLTNAIKNVKNKPFNLAKYVSYGESDTTTIIEIKIFFYCWSAIKLRYRGGTHKRIRTPNTFISISSISTSILIGVNTKSTILIVKIRFNIIRFVRNFDITR